MFFKLLWLRFLQISTNATVTLVSTMEHVLINQTALTAAAQKDLLATDVKQVKRQLHAICNEFSE